MSYETIDYLPDLKASEMNSARHLSFTPYSALNWDNNASVFGSDDYALLHDTYSFNATAGATYDIFSTSYFDPYLLRVYDGYGNTIIANSEGDDPADIELTDGGYYSQDVIWDWVAPYSGTFYVAASWNQGDYYEFYSLNLYEDVDTVSVAPVAPEPVVPAPVAPEPVVPAPVAPEPVAPADLNGWEYLACNNDLMAAFGTDTEAAARHYVDYGYNEGRPTNFDEWGYLASNNDLMAAFGPDPNAAVMHFVTSGHNESRSTDFDEWGYLASNNDLMAAFGADPNAAVRHYVSNGHNEGRPTDFDALSYLAANRDLQAAFGSDVEAATRHYVECGYNEGRAIQLAGVPNAALDTIVIS